MEGNIYPIDAGVGGGLVARAGVVFAQKIRSERKVLKISYEYIQIGVNTPRTW